MSDSNNSRRNFLRAASVTSANLAMGGLDMGAKSYNRIFGANNKVNLAFIGLGARGKILLSEFENTGMVNIVGLCDISHESSTFLESKTKCPEAKLFKDFRTMFDAMLHEIDAVVISLPTFAQFPPCMMAMNYGKHVYVESPMVRTFHEAELLLQASRKYKVVTQMGNQEQSGVGHSQFKAWVASGIIKDIESITVHSNRKCRWHGFDTKIDKYPIGHDMPKDFDWDLWLSSAQYHYYNDMYMDGGWQGWYDFGLGTLGEWGPQILSSTHEYLKLGLPYSVNPIKIEGHSEYIFPKVSTLQFNFPRRDDMPQVDLTWYDGINNYPFIPAEYGLQDINTKVSNIPSGHVLPLKLDPGKIISSKDVIVKGNSHGTNLEVIFNRYSLHYPELEKYNSTHYSNFLLACLGKEESRSPFEKALPLIQSISLGVIAQRLNKKILFDSDKKQITNDAFANALLVGAPPRTDWAQYYHL